MLPGYPGAEEGALTTRPVRFRGAHLFVNVAAAEGELRVEVLDQGGRVLAPFTRAACVPVRADSTRQAVTWKGARDLSALAGRPVRFRFWSWALSLTGANCCAFGSGAFARGGMSSR